MFVCVLYVWQSLEVSPAVSLLHISNSSFTQTESRKLLAAVVWPTHSPICDILQYKSIGPERRKGEGGPAQSRGKKIWSEKFENCPATGVKTNYAETKAKRKGIWCVSVCACIFAQPASCMCVCVCVTRKSAFEAEMEAYRTGKVLHEAIDQSDHGLWWSCRHVSKWTHIMHKNIKNTLPLLDMPSW